MKAFIKAKRIKDGASVQLNGSSFEVMFLLAAIICDIAKTAHIPVEVIMSEANRAVMVFKETDNET